MSADYTHAPLIEALCEFHFNAEQNWDWTIPGLVYAHVRERFPVKQEQQTIRFGMADGQPVSPSPPSVSRVQFLRQDRSALLQVGPNFLGVNHLRPYPGWAAFRDIIFGNLDIYAEIAQPQHVARIDLRYVNKIEVPVSSEEPGFNLSDYLLAIPGVPPRLRSNSMQSFIQRVEIRNADAQGVLALQSGSLPPERADYTPFLLDLDFVTALTEPLSLDKARQWIARAHEEIEHAFEACIGDQARRLFGDKQHG